MMHPLHARVSAILRGVARGVVLPQFRMLAAHQIMEKAPGDLVTVVDRAAEERLSAELPLLLEGSRVVGEEAASVDAAVSDGIDGGLVWIVDPIDGTANYAAGAAPFAIMVGLARDGVVEAGWILDPLTDRMAHAHLGHGAFIDDLRVGSRPTGASPPRMGVATSRLPSDVRERIERRVAGKLDIVPVPLCAGEQYPRLVLGQDDIALFWESMPWDHAPGALFLTEAGGKVARPDGTPYRIGDRRLGIIAAASPDLWAFALEVMFG